MRSTGSVRRAEENFKGTVVKQLMKNGTEKEKAAPLRAAT